MRCMVLILLLCWGGLLGVAVAEPSSQVESSTQTTAPLELQSEAVIRSRELPKVLYIVPWKQADLGKLPGQPMNTLLDELLVPVDRMVLQREVKYFEAIAHGLETKAATATKP